MANSAALFGLIGAIGGATVGGIAGVFGPLLLRRGERRQRLQDKRDDLSDAAIKAMIEARVSTLHWNDFLASTAMNASHGVAVDRLAYAVKRDQLAAEGTKACYALSAFGIRRVSTGDPKWVVGALRKAGDEIDSALRENTFAGGHTPTAVEQALYRAEESRDWLRMTLEHMLNRRFGVHRSLLP